MNTFDKKMFIPFESSLISGQKNTGYSWCIVDGELSVVKDEYARAERIKILSAAKLLPGKNISMLESDVLNDPTSRILTLLSIPSTIGYYSYGKNKVIRKKRLVGITDKDYRYLYNAYYIKNLYLRDFYDAYTEYKDMNISKIDTSNIYSAIDSFYMWKILNIKSTLWMYYDIKNIDNISIAPYSKSPYLLCPVIPKSAIPEKYAILFVKKDISINKIFDGEEDDYCKDTAHLGEMLLALGYGFNKSTAEAHYKMSLIKNLLNVNSISFPSFKNIKNKTILENNSVIAKSENLVIKNKIREINIMKGYNSFISRKIENSLIMMDLDVLIDAIIGEKLMIDIFFTHIPIETTNDYDIELAEKILSSYILLVDKYNIFVTVSKKLCQTLKISILVGKILSYGCKMISMKNSSGIEYMCMTNVNISYSKIESSDSLSIDGIGIDIASLIINESTDESDIVANLYLDDLSIEKACVNTKRFFSSLCWSKEKLNNAHNVLSKGDLYSDRDMSNEKTKEDVFVEKKSSIIERGGQGRLF